MAATNAELSSDGNKQKDPCELATELAEAALLRDKQREAKLQHVLYEQHQQSAND
jgi:hypothetical protein